MNQIFNPHTPVQCANESSTDYIISVYILWIFRYEDAIHRNQKNTTNLSEKMLELDTDFKSISGSSKCESAHLLHLTTLQIEHEHWKS